jgi:SAM-dependent methyltransferase
MCEPSFDPDILSFYSDVYNEDRRIRAGIRELELIRTREIIRRYLPSGRLDVLDVGGGSGVHAEWLLQDGHQVTLLDPVPRHVNEATARLGAHTEFRAEVGDARQLNHPDESFDAVLLLGPLYHLVDRSDRLRAWKEARRATRAGGLVFAVGISRFAELSIGLGREASSLTMTSGR